MRSFAAFSIRRSPSAETSTTSFSAESKPMSSRATSLKTIRSARLLPSFSRARSRPRSPRSAAKPTSTAAPFVPPRAQLAQDVGRRLERHRPGLVVLRPLALLGLGRPVVGDGGGHHDHVRVAAGERLAGHFLGGRRLHHVYSYGRGHREVRRDERHLRPAPPSLGGERRAHPARRAVAEEADRVERLAGPARGHEHAPAAQLLAPLEARGDALEDRLRLAHPPHADLAFGRVALLGTDELDAAGLDELDVRLHRVAAPHARVHRRRGDDRALERERGLRQHVVRQPVRELGQRVRRERRDHQQVGLDQVRVELARRLATGQRLEGLRRDEALGLGRQDRRHLVTRPHEQARELAGLVGRDSTGHTEKNPSHGHIVPAAAQTANPAGP